ncbi:MAG TPA: BatD family protein, partial [Candidatus Eisenbacteria bacterium]|nr:BatD family protein [Candidatus Eisenbacteria bacterium]
MTVIGDRASRLPSRALLAAAIFACAVFVPAEALAAGRLSVEVALDRSTAAVGEDIQATVVLRSDGLELPQFAFPTVPGLTIVRIADSQNFSWINGRLSRSTTTLFRITPTAPGRYTIPSIRIAAGTERAESSPIALEVGTPGSASPPPAAGGAPGTPSPVWGDQSAPDLFVRLDVDRRRVFWNQPLIARYTFYTRVRLEQEALWEISEAPGFWREILGEPRHQRVRVGAYEYLTTQVVMAYFPTRTGRLTIGPGKVEARVLKRINAPDPWSILGMPDVRAETIPLTTDRASIEVRPLPSGAPPGFRGAVGRLSLDVRVDRKLAHVGEPVMVTTLIRGEGNLAAAGDPEVRATLPLRSYEVGGGTTTDRLGDRIRGERRREVAFVPEVPGSFAIEPVRLTWFDPFEERYRSQVSDSIRVTIVPGDSTDRAGGYVAAGPPASLRSRKGPSGTLTLDPSVGAISLAVGSGVVFLAASLWVAAREDASRDPRRRRKAALKRIVLAAREARAKHDASAASRIAALVPEALGIRYDADTDGRSLEDAIAVARVRGATPEVAEEARRLVAAL